MCIAQSSIQAAEFGVTEEMIRVLPGESVVSANGTGLCTILGSCVSVCLYDPDAKIGGMNHFMLPGAGVKQPPSMQSNKYGLYAMAFLCRQMLEAGAEPSRLIARVFGGGKVLAAISSNNIGLSNTQLALEYLQQQKIPVSSSDVLGECYRRIEFWPSSGIVHVKRVDISETENEQRGLG